MHVCLCFLTLWCAFFVMGIHHKLCLGYLLAVLFPPEKYQIHSWAWNFLTFSSPSLLQNLSYFTIIFPEILFCEGEKYLSRILGWFSFYTKNISQSSLNSKPSCEIGCKYNFLNQADEVWHRQVWHLRIWWHEVVKQIL